MADRASKTKRRSGGAGSGKNGRNGTPPPSPRPRPVDALFGESVLPGTGTFVVEPPQAVTTVSPPPLDYAPPVATLPSSTQPAPRDPVRPAEPGPASVPDFAFEPAGEPEDSNMPYDESASPPPSRNPLEDWYASPAYPDDPQPVYPPESDDPYAQTPTLGSEYDSGYDHSLPPFNAENPNAGYDSPSVDPPPTIADEPPPSSYFYESASPLDAAESKRPVKARGPNASSRPSNLKGVANTSRGSKSSPRVWTPTVKQEAKPNASSYSARSPLNRPGVSPFADLEPPGPPVPTPAPVPASSVSNPTAPVSTNSTAGPTAVPTYTDQELYSHLPALIRQLYDQVAVQLSDSPLVSDYCMKLLLQARETYQKQDYATAEFYAQTASAKIKRSIRSMELTRSPLLLMLWVWQVVMLGFSATVIGLTYIPNLILFGFTLTPELIILARAVGWGGIGGVIGALYNMPWFMQYREYDPAYNMNYFTRPLQGLIIGGVIFLVSQAGMFAGSIFLPTTAAADTSETPVGPVFLYVVAALAGFKQEYVYEFLDNVLKTVFRLPKLPNELQIPLPSGSSYQQSRSER